MTKQQVLEQFKETYGDIKQAVKNDRIAVAEDWSIYTDLLCKDGQITERQYNTWSNPF